MPEISFTPEEITALAVDARSVGDARAGRCASSCLGRGGRLASLEGRRPAGWGCVRTRGSPPRPRRSPGCGAASPTGPRTAETCERLVDAYGAAVGGGRWYVVGLDAARDEMRSFPPVTAGLGPRGRGGGKRAARWLPRSAVDRAGGEVRAAMQVLVREALVVPEVQDRLGAVVEHEHLAVLGTGASCWGRRAGPGRASGGRPAGPGSGRGGRGRAVAIPLPRPEATPRVTTMLFASLNPGSGVAS
jgi:hypothetical protein